MRVVEDWMDNLWRSCPDALFFCSNGVISERGRAVMGAGTARAAMKIACGSAAVMAELRDPPSDFVHVASRNRTFVEDYISWKQGSLLAANGNISQLLFSELVGEKWRSMGSLPTKLGNVRIRQEHLCYVLPEYVGRIQLGTEVPGWMLRSDVTLIKRSIDDMVRLADLNDWGYVAFPSPGAGAGDLGETETRELDEYIHALLDKRFVMFSRPDKKSKPAKKRR